MPLSHFDIHNSIPCTVTGYLEGIQLNTVSDFEDVIRALESIVTNTPMPCLPVHILEQTQGLREYLNPDYRFFELANQAEFERVVHPIIREKIIVLRNMTLEDQAEEIERQRRYRIEVASNHGRMRQHSSPTGRARTITFEQMVAEYRQGAPWGMTREDGFGESEFRVGSPSAAQLPQRIVSALDAQRRSRLRRLGNHMPRPAAVGFPPQDQNPINGRLSPPPVPAALRSCLNEEHSHSQQWQPRDERLAQILTAHPEIQPLLGEGILSPMEIVGHARTNLAGFIFAVRAMHDRRICALILNNRYLSAEVIAFCNENPMPTVDNILLRLLRRDTRYSSI